MKLKLLKKVHFSLMLFLMCLPTLVLAQTETVYIDFGVTSTSSASPWNNISNNVSGSISNLINSNTVNTGISITITDGFPGINEVGTTSPDAGLNFPSSATRDSFYGQNTDGGSFLFTNLVIGKSYTLTFFASRVVTPVDNRETSYTVIGASSQTVNLNATNNTATTVSITFQPKADGTAVLNVAKGAANTNSSGFFYIGLLKLQYTTAAPTYSNNALQVDFGISTNITAGNWNNMTNNLTTGVLNNLISKAGGTTNIKLEVTDSFNYSNENGTTAAGQSLGLPTTATADSFFGNTVLFQGKTEPTGAVKYSNFDPTNNLSLTFYASRMDYVDLDNRETQYTIEGLTTETVYLNVANNVNNTVSKTLKPKADGTLTITVSKGPNNTNANGFYYLGAMIVEYTPTPSIALISPNGGEFWQVGKTTEITWTSSNLSAPVTLEYSTNNGASWNLISNSVSNLVNTYNWVVPNAVSANCLVRATSGAVQDSSNGVFEISNDATVNTIVVIGSSTAEGTGASTLAKSWVSLYAAALYKKDTRFNVVNLGKGGYTTYHVLPTGTTIPSGVSVTVDTDRNITKALSYNPMAIIVNMPSNDTNSGYSVADQIANYNTLHHESFINDVPFWVATTQPKNFADSAKIQMQIDVRDAILAAYPLMSLNFWTDIADTDGTIIAGLNSGDGTHLNDSGHALLFNKVLNSNVLTTLVPVCSITTWNGTAWSNVVPKRSSSAYVTGDFTASGNMDACNITVENDATFTVPSGLTLTIYGTVTTTNGTLSMESDASLLQTEDAAVNVGTKFEITRKTNPMYRYDYTYWSSPVVGQTLYNLSPDTFSTKYMGWNATDGTWTPYVGGTHTMVAGRGYIVRAPQTYSTDPSTVTVFDGLFVGKPTNGIVQVATVGKLTEEAPNVYNLLGNPYPSALSADAFLIANQSLLEGTLYFWTHHTPFNTTGASTYSYTTTDYAAYNLLGGTGTAAESIETPNASDVPNGFIASGQGFFVGGTVGGTVTFNNAMREMGNNDLFFRSGNEVVKNRLWFNISNTNGSFNQTLLGYTNAATTGFDKLWDGGLFSSSNLNIYTFVATKKLSIQSLPVPLVVSDAVALGYTTTFSGNHKIALDKMDGLFVNQAVYLHDKVLDVVHNIKLSAYEFVSEAGTFDERFEVIYENTTLGSAGFAKEKELYVYKEDQKIHVKSPLMAITRIQVVDMQGRVLQTLLDVNGFKATIELHATEQVLFVSITLDDLQVLTRKLLY